MDATFRCCPRPYKQMFTILGQFQGHVVPLVYALMTRRGIGQYRQVFQCVKTAVRERTHHHWRPAQIVCDFERVLWTSIETELPRARLQGCYFHFTQCLFRKVCNEWHSFHARVGRFSPFLYLRSVAIAVILFWSLVVLVSPCFLGSRIPRDCCFPRAPLFLCSERKPS